MDLQSKSFELFDGTWITLLVIDMLVDWFDVDVDADWFDVDADIDLSDVDVMLMLIDLLVDTFELICLSYCLLIVAQ